LNALHAVWTSVEKRRSTTVEGVIVISAMNVSTNMGYAFPAAKRQNKNNNAKLDGIPMRGMPLHPAGAGATDVK
jgi:hypothetical protein